MNYQFDLELTLHLPTLANIIIVVCIAFESWGVPKFDQVSIMEKDSKSNMATALNSFIFSHVSLACFYYISHSFHLCHSLRGFQ